MSSGGRVAHGSADETAKPPSKDPPDPSTAAAPSVEANGVLKNPLADAGKVEPKQTPCRDNNVAVDKEPIADANKEANQLPAQARKGEARNTPTEDKTDEEASAEGNKGAAKEPAAEGNKSASKQAAEQAHNNMTKESAAEANKGGLKEPIAEATEVAQRELVVGGNKGVTKEPAAEDNNSAAKASSTEANEDAITEPEGEASKAEGGKGASLKNPFFEPTATMADAMPPPKTTLKRSPEDLEEASPESEYPPIPPPPKKRRRRKVHTCNRLSELKKKTLGGIRVGVIAADYPETVLSAQQLELLRVTVLEQLAPEKQGAFKPKFLGTSAKPGFIIFHCEDKATVLWLKKVLQKLKAVVEADLRVLERSQIPRKLGILGYFPNECRDRFTKIFQTIKKHNTGLNVDSWVLHKVVTKATFAVDHQSAAKLVERKFIINFNQRVIEFHPDFKFQRNVEFPVQIPKDCKKGTTQPGNTRRNPKLPRPPKLEEMDLDGPGAPTSQLVCPPGPSQGPTPSQPGPQNMPPGPHFGPDMMEPGAQMNRDGANSPPPSGPQREPGLTRGNHPDLILAHKEETRLAMEASKDTVEESTTDAGKEPAADGNKSASKQVAGEANNGVTKEPSAETNKNASKESAAEDKCMTKESTTEANTGVTVEPVAKANKDAMKEHAAEDNEGATKQPGEEGNKDATKQHESETNKYATKEPAEEANKCVKKESATEANKCVAKECTTEANTGGTKEPASEANKGAINGPAAEENKISTVHQRAEANKDETKILAPQTQKDATEEPAAEANESASKQPEAEGHASVTKEPAAEANESASKQPEAEGHASVTKEPAAEANESASKQPEAEGHACVTKEPAAEASESASKQPEAEGHASVTKEPAAEDNKRVTTESNKSATTETATGGKSGKRAGLMDPFLAPRATASHYIDAVGDRVRFRGPARRRFKWLLSKGFTPHEARELVLNCVQRLHSARPLPPLRRALKRSAESDDVAQPPPPPKKMTLRDHLTQLPEVATAQLAGIHVGVIAADYPETVLSAEQLELLRVTVLEQLVPEKQGAFKPKLLGTVVKPGYIIFQCENQNTVLWLKKVLHRLSAAVEVELRALAQCQLPRKLSVVACFPDKRRQECVERILDTIKRHNQGLNVDAWVPQKIITQASIHVDHQSAAKLVKDDFKVNFKKRKLELKPDVKFLKNVEVAVNIPKDPPKVTCRPGKKRYYPPRPKFEFVMGPYGPFLMDVNAKGKTPMRRAGAPPPEAPSWNAGQPGPNPGPPLRNPMFRNGAQYQNPMYRAGPSNQIPMCGNAPPNRSPSGDRFAKRGPSVGADGACGPSRGNFPNLGS